MPLSKQDVRELRDQLAEQLQAFAELTGYQATVGSAKFTADSVMFKVELGRVAEDGSVASEAATEFKRCASLYGLKAEDLGRQFSYQDRRFVITGLNRRSKKFPITAREVSTGKTWKFTPELVKAGLWAASKEPAPAEALYE